MHAQIRIIAIVVLALLAIAGPASGQLPTLGSSLVSKVFTNPQVFAFDNEDIQAEAREEKGLLTIRLTSLAQPPRKGWGGACIESSTNMNLMAFGGMSFYLEPTAEVGLDVKFEQTDNRYQAYVFTASRDRFRPPGRVVVGKFMDMRREERRVLSRTQRLCFAVTARSWPHAEESVTLKIREILLTQ